MIVFHYLCNNKIASFDEDDNDNSKVNPLHFRFYCDLQNIFTHRDSTNFHRERRVAFPYVFTGH